MFGVRGYIKFVQYKIIQQTSINCGSPNTFGHLKQSPAYLKCHSIKHQDKTMIERLMTNFFSISQYSSYCFHKVILYKMYSSVQILGGLNSVKWIKVFLHESIYHFPGSKKA